jgi:hypothetical protein
MGTAIINPIDLNNISSDVCGIASFTVSETTFTCVDIGANNVTLTVTDNNGNLNACLAVVTVVDNIPPTLSCKNDTVYLDTNGTAILNAISLNNGSNDACGIGSLTASKTTFTCSDIGINNVTLTVTDNNGNVASCIALVTVMDTINPMVNCQNRMVYLDKNCQFVVPDYVAINQLIDNCDTTNVKTKQTPAVGTVLTTLGNQNIRIFVTDESGNIDSCNFTIAVIDQDAPKVFCPENQEVTTNYSCVYKIEDYRALARKDLDNCDINNVRITQFPIAGTMVSGTPINNSENSAQTRVTILIEDQSGNKDSCHFIVDVTCISAIVISEFISPYGD